MKFPRVLVVANNCFSQTNANGRTLGNLFDGWPKDSLAQFTLGTLNPNFEICNNYYCVTDRQALISVFQGGKHIGKHITNTESLENPNALVQKRAKKTAIKMLLRQLVWSMGRWKNRRFKQWVDDFKPEIVLVQSGDAAFMLQIASVIAKEYNIPLVFFNTEGHYFFKNNYFRKNWADIVVFPIYQKLFNNIYKKIIGESTLSIHGNQLLKNDFDKEFGKPSIVIYTSSNMDFAPKQINQTDPTFSYLGNFEFDRALALMDIAQALSEINPNYRLNVYGSADEEVLSRINVKSNICYHGFVSYTDVVKVMRDSDILFHAECQNEKWREVLKYGFSTKIADSISSGSNFILYSSSELACAQYIQSTNAAWFVKSKEELKDSIIQILNESSLQKEILSNASTVAKQNHDINLNRQIFREALQNISIIKS